MGQAIMVVSLLVIALFVVGVVVWFDPEARRKR